MIVGPHALGILASQRSGSAMSYKDLSLSYDPVAHWGLDEESSTIAVDETGDHDGAYNGPTLDQAPLIQSGRAVSFDGADDYIEIPSSTDFDFTLPFAVSFWINTTINGSCLLFERGGNGVFSVQISSNPTGAIICNLNGEIGVAKTSDTFNDGSTYFIVVTFKSGPDSTIHVNGQQASLSQQRSGGQPSYGSSPIRVGKRDEWSSGYAGRMDEVVLWDRELTAQEITDLYNKGIGQT